MLLFLLYIIHDLYEFSILFSVRKALELVFKTGLKISSSTVVDVSTAVSSFPVPGEFVWSNQITFYIILPSWVSP